MRKILCDRCGAEIPLNSKIGYVAVNWRAPSDGSLMYENRYEGYDFCEQCMEDIIAVADSICAHSEVIEEKKGNAGRAGAKICGGDEGRICIGAGGAWSVYGGGKRTAGS